MSTKIYRPDIDGLRAIAVLSVLIYHTFPHILPGGFVGVDIFFVISGYLITSILTKEFLNGSFSYKHFYYRRIKRIFPALLLVVFVSLTFGWFILLPDEFKQLGKHTIGGMSFLSNIMLLTELGYFDNSSELKPFIHLWSLGVEEQFYIFWPIILSSVFLLKQKKIVIIFILALMSFILNIYYTNNSPSLAYYLPFTRFWELAIGGILALIMHKNKTTAPSKTYLSLFGLILIIISLIITNKNSAFPGFIALLPTFGAACIILSSSEGYINKAFLSQRLMVWIGLISYPLYLWHWPIITFTRIITDELTPTSKILCLILSVICAWLTYSMLEKNIKNTSKSII